MSWSIGQHPATNAETTFILFVQHPAHDPMQTACNNQASPLVDLRWQSRCTAGYLAGSAKPLPVQANGISHYFRPWSAPAPAAKRTRPSSGQMSLPSLLGSQPSQPLQRSRTLGPSHLSSSSSQAAASHPSSQRQDPPDSLESQGQHPAGQAQPGPTDWGRGRGGSAPSCLAGFAMRPGAAQIRSVSPDQPDDHGSRPDQAPPAGHPPGVLPAPAGSVVPVKGSFNLPRQAAGSAMPGRERCPLPQHAAASLPEAPAAKQAAPATSGSRFGAFRFQPQATTSVAAQQQQQQRSQGPRNANAAAMLRRQSVSALPSGLHPSLQPAAACLQAGRSAADTPPSHLVAQPPSGQQGPLRQGGLAAPQQWGFDTTAAPSSHAPSEPASQSPATLLKHSRDSSQSDLDCSLGSPPYEQADPAEADCLSELEQIQDTPVDDDSALVLSPVPQIPLRRAGPHLEGPPCSPAASPDTARPDSEVQCFDHTRDEAAATSPASSQMLFMYEAAGGPSPEAVPDTAPRPSPAAAAAAAAAAAGSETEPSASRLSCETASPAKKHPLAWATCQQPRLQRSLLRRRSSSQVSAIPCVGSGLFTAVV